MSPVTVPGTVTANIRSLRAGLTLWTAPFCLNRTSVSLVWLDRFFMHPQIAAQIHQGAYIMRWSGESRPVLGSS